jgi:hypothetical protein
MNVMTAVTAWTAWSSVMYTSGDPPIEDFAIFDG